MKKLTPYQERLARLRAENLFSENEIAKLMGKKPQTIRVQFMQIREILGIPTFEQAYREYKNKIKAAQSDQHVECQEVQQNQSLAD